MIAPGKVTANSDQLLHAMDGRMHMLRVKAPKAVNRIILSTELSATKYNKPLQNWCDDHEKHLYHPLRSGADECCVISDLPFDDHLSMKLTDMHLTKATTNRIADIYFDGAHVKDGGWFGDWHTPAHNGGLALHNHPADVYRSALHGLKDAATHMHGKKFIAADYNVALDRQEMRDAVGQDFPNLKWTWHPGQKGTEGGRVIDGAMTNMTIITKAETLMRPWPGLDHKDQWLEVDDSPVIGSKS
jgi:hypothetical protein